MMSFYWHMERGTCFVKAEMRVLRNQVEGLLRGLKMQLRVEWHHFGFLSFLNLMPSPGKKQLQISEFSYAPSFYAPARFVLIKTIQSKFEAVIIWYWMLFCLNRC